MSCPQHCPPEMSSSAPATPLRGRLRQVVRPLRQKSRHHRIRQHRQNAGYHMFNRDVFMNLPSGTMLMNSKTGLQKTAQAPFRVCAVFDILQNFSRGIFHVRFFMRDISLTPLCAEKSPDLRDGHELFRSKLIGIQIPVNAVKERSGLRVFLKILQAHGGEQDLSCLLTVSAWPILLVSRVPGREAGILLTSFVVTV